MKTLSEQSYVPMVAHDASTDDDDDKYRKRRVTNLKWQAARSCACCTFLFVLCSLLFAIFHEKSKGLLNSRNQERLAGTLLLPAYFDQAKHYYSQSNLGLRLRKLSNSKSARDAQHADAYFRSQLPHFMRSMKDYKLHSHFAGMQLPQRISFHGMISARGKHLLRNFEQHGWADFKIEKDKCAMFEFLRGNGLPHTAWEGIYRKGDGNTYTVDDALFRVRSALRNSHELPMFIKSCHITTGAAKSVKMIRSREEYEQGWTTIDSWARDMWMYQSNDWERVWGPSFNRLCATLTPGFMVQGPWVAGRMVYPQEIKIEVIWGRAYLAFVSTGKCGGDRIILRDGTVTKYSNTMLSDVLHQGEPDPCYRWIVQEGHLPRAWHMAESAAKLMGIDAVRIDVFLLPGHPELSVINENSLSSGAEYRWHFQHMAELWAMGHRMREYLVFDPGVDAHMVRRGEAAYNREYARCNTTFMAKQFSRVCGKR